LPYTCTRQVKHQASSQGLTDLHIHVKERLTEGCERETDLKIQVMRPGEGLLLLFCNCLQACSSVMRLAQMQRLYLLQRHSIR